MRESAAADERDAHGPQPIPADGAAVGEDRLPRPRPGLERDVGVSGAPARGTWLTIPWPRRRAATPSAATSAWKNASRRRGRRIRHRAAHRHGQHPIGSEPGSIGRRRAKLRNSSPAPRKTSGEARPGNCGQVPQRRASGAAGGASRSRHNAPDRSAREPPAAGSNPKRIAGHDRQPSGEDRIGTSRPTPSSRGRFGGASATTAPAARRRAAGRGSSGEREPRLSIRTRAARRDARPERAVDRELLPRAGRARASGWRCSRTRSAAPGRPRPTR